MNEINAPLVCLQHSYDTNNRPKCALINCLILRYRFFLYADQLTIEM